MSTPLKALIQERLRAKMVRQGPDYGFDDEYECDSDRRLRQPMDVTAYDLTSRDDVDEILMNSSSRGSNELRGSSASTSYPVRLHTHIDPSAYLVPSPHGDQYYPPPSPYGGGSSSHDGPGRHRYSRYPREQFRETSMYDPHPRHEQPHHSQNRRRHHHQQRVREQQPRCELTSRGGYGGRHTSHNRVSVTPWHRPDYTTTSSKPRSMPRSPVHGMPTSTCSPTLRGQHEKDFRLPEEFGNDYTRQQFDPKSALPSPKAVKSKFGRSSSSNHHSQPHTDYQHDRYVWSDREYGNQSSVCDVTEPSPTQHHRNQNYPTPTKHRSHCDSHPNQIDDTRNYEVEITPASPTQCLPEETSLADKVESLRLPERQTPPPLEMDIIEAAPQVIGRTRVWDAILSPESRLAAKAFVEKRRRRSDKSTPRTRATQQWLELIDSREQECKRSHETEL